MKTIYKVLLCFGIGISFIIAGVSIGGLSEVYPFEFIGNLNLRWRPHSIENIEFQANINTDEIDIDIHKGNVEFQVRDDIQNIQIHASQIYSGFEIYQKGDKIVIEQPHYWRWFSQYDSANIQIDVPKDFEFQKADIDMSAGNTTIHQLQVKKLDVNAAAGRLELNDVRCYEINLDASMGETVMNQLTFEKRMDIDLGMGNVDILLNGHSDDYNYSVDVGLGNVNIGNERFSGIADKKSNHSQGQKFIDVDCGLGNVNIEMEEYE